MRALALAIALFSALPARAFVRSQDPMTEVCLYWTKREVPWVLNEKGSADVAFADVEAALKRSFSSWEAAGCSDLSFRYDGTTPRHDTGIQKDSATNLNIITWRERTCALAAPRGDACFANRTCRSAYDCWQNASGVIALTTASFSRSTGVVLDADIEFNGSVDVGGSEFRFTAGLRESPVCQRPTDTDCVGTDIENTATHEIGHFLGLDHTPVPEATMYASAPVGETKKRSLDQDDLDGLCEIYPKGARTKTCTPSGWITLTPGVASVADSCSSAGPAGALALVALAARFRRRRNS